jgi:hypothetical protein
VNQRLAHKFVLFASLNFRKEFENDYFIFDGGEMTNWASSSPANKKKSKF